jgi:zinc transport system permease protein
MINLFQYNFVVNGTIAGLIIAIVAPAIGVFLVLRRYSLIADTLSHVSLAGIALGLLLKINPLLTALGATTIMSVVIDKLRLSRKVYGESALALFLSGSLAFAIVLIGISNGFNSGLFNYLFGSIATVTTGDIYMVGVLAAIVLVVLAIIYNELLFITFDEDAARVSGIPVNGINTIFIMLAAVTISLSIPIVGILLISSLLVIPVVASLQFKKTIIPTILIAQAISIFSVILGVILSFYFNLAPGGTIVLISLIIFVIIQALT